MLNFNRRSEEPKESARALRPAIYEPPGTPVRATAPPPTAPGPVPESQVAAARPPEPVLADVQIARLAVGVNIKLKGVEISDCDVMHIEGHVEATVHSKSMQIAKPGTLHGTALIDVAEIHGEFSGDLTARLRLVVHATGRVSGIIRYGKLVVEEGGELSGDVKRLDAPAEPVVSRVPGADARVALRPSPEAS
jgi:cytoskeletal protein CcmA (bactofilin family)